MTDNCPDLRADLKAKLETHKEEMLENGGEDVEKVDFEIVMGDFNEMGTRDEKCGAGRGGCLAGFWTPDGGGVPTLHGGWEADRILYDFAGAKLLGIETFVVPRRGAVEGGREYKGADVDPDREVSDHRPRRLVLPI